MHYFIQTEIVWVPNEGQEYPDLIPKNAPFFYIPEGKYKLVYGNLKQDCLFGKNTFRICLDLLGTNVTAKKVSFDKGYSYSPSDINWFWEFIKKNTTML